MRVDTDTHTNTHTHTKHKTQCTRHPPHCTLETALLSSLLKKKQVVASHACWHKQKHTHVHTLSSEMLLRRLRTLPTASKRVLWKAITRKYYFCAYDIKLFSGQDSTSTGLHLKRPNTDTASAVCICVMFALNLLLSEDQYQRGHLSLISLKRRKLLHHMRVDTYTQTKHNAR